MRNIFALTSVLEPRGRRGRDRAQRPRGAGDARAGRGARRAHRPRADGRHDAGDGRPHRDARDPQAAASWQRAADHRAHRQGDARRPREVPRRRRQRLHRQAARRRQAAVAGPRLDAASRAPCTRRTPSSTSSCGCCSRRSTCKYHYDFRQLRARLAASAGCAQALTQLRLPHALGAAGRACCTSPRSFRALLALPHRAGQRDVPRPGVLPRAARAGRAAAAHLPVAARSGSPAAATGEEVYSLAILLREEGLLERTLIYATDINPEALREAEAGVYALERMARLHRELPRVGRPRRRSSDYYTAAYGARGVRQPLRKQRRVLRPQPRDRSASSPRCSSSPAATC